ncbi:MAG: amidohydrolase family protein, partial [Armatimonadota bacterium]
MLYKSAAACLAALLVLAMTPSSASSTSKLAITNTNLFDSITGTMLPNRTIVVEGDRITAIGTPDDPVAIPDDAEVVKGKGKYVIPGLIDAHVHLSFLLDEVGISGESMLPLYLGNGVTSVRGVGDAILPAKAVADYASAHPGTCPNVFTCGPLVDGDPPFHPTCARSITDPAQVPAFLDEMLSYSVSTVKLYVGVSPEVFAKVCEEAHKRGLTVAAHLGSVSTQQAVDYGLDTIEHIWGAPTDSAVMVDMVSRGVMLAPTLVVFRNMIYLCDLPEVYTDPSNYYAPKALHDSWDKHRMSSGYNQSNRADRIALVESYKKLTGRLYKAGVTLLAGTDSAEPYCLPGFALHTELELLNQSGIPPAAVLQCATINNARALKQQANIGSVEVGKIADMVILNANPLSDIKNTRKIHRVVHNGMLTDPKRVLPKRRRPLKPKSCIISGVVTYAGDTVEGVKVAAVDGTSQTITDSEGRYEI